ncbi:accessory gene regulator ArgB-like protein [Cohnella sp. 56]|uniref:accessory gene regulator ArgB-like protein n=1 Tax=Cohnella sp. 56 TaxID=3113722 RepID=UPI0030E81B47
MTDAIAVRLAHRIKRLAPDNPASVEVMAFALSAYINLIAIVTTSLLVSLATGQTKGALAALISFAVVRQVSGGYHLKSGALCIAVSVTGITTLSYADFGAVVSLVLSAISAVLAAIYAPSRIDNQTRIPRRFYPHLKIASIVLICIGHAIGYSPIIAAMFVQALTLIRKGGEKNA